MPSRKYKVRIPTPEERQRMIADMEAQIAAKWGTKSPEQKLMDRMDLATARVLTIRDIELKEQGVVRDRADLFNAMTEEFIMELHKFNKEEIEVLFASFLTAKHLETVFS